MINVPAVGRLVKDIELNETRNQKPYARFTLACKTGNTDQEGKAESTFIECVQWGKRAETLMKYTAKGSLLSVIGVLENNNYTDKDGIKRYGLQLRITDFEFLESSEQTLSRQQANVRNQQNGQYQDQVDRIANAQQNNQNQGQQGYANQQPQNYANQPQQQNQPPYNQQQNNQPSIDGMNQYGANNGR